MVPREEEQREGGEGEERRDMWEGREREGREGKRVKEREQGEKRKEAEQRGTGGKSWKRRNGPIGTVRLSFVGQFTRFENYAGPRYDDYMHE